MVAIKTVYNQLLTGRFMNIIIPTITRYKIYDIFKPITSIAPNDAKKKADSSKYL